MVLFAVRPAYWVKLSAQLDELPALVCFSFRISYLFIKKVHNENATENTAKGVRGIDFECENEFSTKVINFHEVCTSSPPTNSDGFNTSAMLSVSLYTNTWTVFLTFLYFTSFFLLYFPMARVNLKISDNFHIFSSLFISPIYDLLLLDAKNKFTHLALRKMSNISCMNEIYIFFLPLPEILFNFDDFVGGKFVWKNHFFQYSSVFPLQWVTRREFLGLVW